MSSGRTQRKHASRQVTAGRIVLGAVIAASIAILVALVWAGARAAQALPHIERAQQLAAELDMQAVLAGGDDDLRALQRELAAARDHSGGVAWSVAEALPWAGPQFAGARTLLEVLDDLASTGLATAAEAGSGLDTLLPSDGRVDLSALGALHERLDTALSSVADARDRLASLDPAALIPPLRDGAAQAQGLLDEAEPALDGAVRATALLPGLLGADGPREHLLLLQNNAEWRSLGGIVGSVIEITATEGQIELTDQVAGASFGRHDQPITPLGFETEVVYGDRPARYMQNPTMIPDFAEAAAVARAFWTSQRGGDPTGVIAFDPVALSYLLAATGPVPLPTGEVLTSDNAVSLLLNEVYLRYEDPAEQDAFFGAAAHTVFQALLRGDADPATALDALSRAVEERRLLVWSADERERDLLAGTTVAGEMPSSDEQTTEFGVYLNDGSGAKLDYYMTAGVGTARCSADTAVLRVELSNEAPPDIREYPDYLLGTPGEQTESGVPRGIARTLVYVYLAEGADLISDAGAARLVGQHSGHAVYEWSTDLAPGDSAALELRVQTSTAPSLDILTTPVLHPVDVVASC